MWKLLFLVWVGACIVHSQEEDATWKVVDISQGTVRGQIDPQGDLYTFYNIPYASVPTGVNKFKAPLPPPVWTEKFDAVNRNIACPQATGSANRQEDCLVANVFVPQTDETNLPVVVYIHDGSYNVGNGLSHIFMDLVRTKKVIVVSFNYRLGAYGFLCLRTEAAPGNAGTKDQIALLRWVNTNIASFGGNPEEVTLVGCSAGSGSVDLLTLSKATEGLFKRAIIQSGVSTGATGVQIDPIGNAKTYARLLGFENVDDIESLEEFYTTATIDQLLSRAEAITNNIDSNVLFAPCVEKDLEDEAVILDAPLNIIRSGNYNKIPLLYGFTNFEGAMRIGQFQTWSAMMNEKFADFLPVELRFETDEDKEDVAQRVKEYYFGDAPVSEDKVQQYIYYFTDAQFACPMLRSLTARIESLGDTIFLFEYSFTDENSNTILNTDLRGAGHCAANNAVMDISNPSITAEYSQMRSVMQEYWINFILTGNPSAEGSTLPSWTPAAANRSPHMSLGPIIELKGVVLQERAEFWDDIYAQYYGGPGLPENDDSGAVSMYISHILIVIVLVLNVIF